MDAYKKVTFLAILLIFSVCALSCATTKPEIPQSLAKKFEAGSWRDKGDSAFISGKIDEAIQYYKQAIKLNPSYAYARLNLGDAYYTKNMIQEAITEYSLCIALDSIDSTTSSAHLGLGLAYWKLNRHAEAIEALKQATKLDPYNAGAFATLGYFYSMLGKYQQAIIEYEKSIYINSSYEDVYINLAGCYFGIGKYKKAKDLYNQAIKINPKSANAYLGLGRTCALLEEYDRAIDASKTSIELYPANAEAHFILGGCYHEKDRNSLSAYHFYEAGLMYLEMNYKEQALAAYEAIKLTNEKKWEQALYSKIYP